jgi:hypothetical protein
MTCDEFARRMNAVLDCRRSPDADGPLRQHADACPSCGARLKAWRRITAVLPVGRQPDAAETLAPPPARRPVAISLAVLAAVIWFVAAIHGSRSASVGRVALESQRGEPHDTALAQGHGELNPALWWRRVQDRDWIGQTMPAVDSVRQGVAPLGRSLRRAVTILTVGHEQTS